MKWPQFKLPWSISFASFINALSIPLIAGLLWWTLTKILTPSEWCPALEEFKLTQAAAAAALRCQPVLLAQIDVGKYTAIGLVAALSLSHLVSVVREARAGLELATKWGSVKVGGDHKATEAAKFVEERVAEAGAEAVEEVEASEEPRPTTKEGELP
jgi:hypothetical protein